VFSGKTPGEPKGQAGGIFNEGFSMSSKQKLFLGTVVLGLLSFGTLVLCFLAGRQIRPDSTDVYPGQWRVILWGFWPVALFHLVFFISATKTMMKWKK